jgi:hypothetical protein
MRADMKKVIVERPRYNRGASNNKSAHRLTSGEIAAVMADEESFDNPGTIQRNRDKSFNEHLGPLRSFLRRNVGRPWNKVYSEIRELEYRPAVTEEDRNDPRYSKTWKKVLVAKRQCDPKTIQQTYSKPNYLTVRRQTDRTCSKASTRSIGRKGQSLLERVRLDASRSQ